MHVKQLKLVDFRNIEAAKIEVGSASIVALVGHNGAGKTSILEALSLLSPGHGLNRAKWPEIGRNASENGWGFFAKLEIFESENITTEPVLEECSVGLGFNGKAREIKVNGQFLERQTGLSELGNVVWFTPKMDRLFLDAPAARREFLDRLVFGLFPTHAANLARYRFHLKNRLRLLKDGISGDWLDLEEEKCAEFGLLVAQARQEFVNKLNSYATEVVLNLAGNVDRALLSDNSRDEFTKQLKAYRERDLGQNSSNFGPQKSDLTGVIEIAKNKQIQLDKASTGQHKRGLLHILLANAQLIHDLHGKPPLLLFDEVAAHLDKAAQKIVFNQLVDLGSQVWVAGTDKNTFKSLKNAKIIEIADGAIKDAK